MERQETTEGVDRKRQIVEKVELKILEKINVKSQERELKLYLHLQYP